MRKLSKVCLFCFIAGIDLLISSASAATFSKAEAQLLLSSNLSPDKLQKISKLQLSERHENWPLYTFLVAENLYKTKEYKKARTRYQEIIKHAGTDPYGDTLGQSSFVSFALYRWLTIAEKIKDVTREDFESIAQSADQLMHRSLVRAAYTKHSILPSLPLFREQIFDKLSQVALLIGSENSAGKYFFNFLKYSRDAKLDFEKDPRYSLILKHKISSVDQINLLRGKFLRSLGKKYRPQAQKLLEKVLLSNDEETKFQAQFSLTRISSWAKENDVEEIYEDIYLYSSDADLVQETLLRRGLYSGSINAEAYKAPLKLLIEDYPKHRKTDDAYYWLGRGEQLTGNLDESLSWYSKVSNFEDSNHNYWWASYYPAIGLIWRNQLGDLEKAAQIFSQFIEDYPENENTAAAHFWLGRIHETQNNKALTKQHYQAVIEKQPYGYYGIRSQMHLAFGVEAKSRILINDAQLKSMVKKHYLSGSQEEPLTGSKLSVYYRRIISAIDNHIYQTALYAEQELRELAPTKRIPDLNFEELDQLNLIAKIATLISLRSDALATININPDPGIRMNIAQLIGERVKDWPLTMSLVHQVPVQRTTASEEIMNNPNYLATTYPKVYEQTILQKSKSQQVPSGILYAVMRHESYFYPPALSHVGALGLFQFMPATYEDLNRKWNMTPLNDAKERRRYLLQADNSIDLGARWFGKQQLPSFNQNPFYAMIAHHSGTTRTKRWVKHWKGKGVSNDIELMVETFRMPGIGPEKIDKHGVEARSLARSTMRDFIISDAIDLFSLATAGQ